jgi:hypothetical protein
LTIEVIDLNWVPLKEINVKNKYMGKSFNRNQDRYGKYQKQRDERDRKRKNRGNAPRRFREDGIDRDVNLDYF